jgi:hypothetical protein
MLNVQFSMLNVHFWTFAALRLKMKGNRKDAKPIPEYPIT